MKYKANKTLSHHSFSTLEVLANAIRYQKEIKGVQIEKEEIYLFLFANNKIIYVEKLKETITKLLKQEFKASLQDTWLIHRSSSLSNMSAMNK